MVFQQANITIQQFYEEINLIKIQYKNKIIN
jgi:hypothetical protein